MQPCLTAPPAAGWVAPACAEALLQWVRAVDFANTYHHAHWGASSRTITELDLGGVGLRSRHEVRPSHRAVRHSNGVSAVPGVAELSGGDAVKAGAHWLVAGVFSDARARRELAECCVRAFVPDARGNRWTNTQAVLSLLMEVQGIVLLG